MKRCCPKTVTKLLVAGRVDGSRLRVNADQVKGFAKEHGFARYLETSATPNTGCDELKVTVLDRVDWKEMQWAPSSQLSVSGLLESKQRHSR